MEAYTAKVASREEKSCTHKNGSSSAIKIEITHDVMSTYKNTSI
jgi:hypothetical protein